MKQTVWKKIMSLAASACLLVSAMSIGVSGEEISGKNYLAIGDSITTGYGLNAGESSFPELIAADRSYMLDMQAADGETSSTLLSKAENSGLGAGISTADVITLTIGGNDLMNALYSFLTARYNEENPGNEISEDAMKELLLNGDNDIISFAAEKIPEFDNSVEETEALTEFQNNLGQIIKAIKDQNADAWIIVATQYNPYRYLADKYESYTENARIVSDAFEAGAGRLNSVITALSTQAGAEYDIADVHGAFAAANDAGRDLCNASVSIDLASGSFSYSINLDFHPNKDGHAEIAEVMENVIESKESESDSELSDALARIMAVEELKVVDQEKVNSEEAAKAWAEELIKPVLSDGMTADVSIVDFTAASAGTEDNAAGTDGSFKIVVSVELNGNVSESVTVAETQITATAYVEPEEPGDDEQQPGDDEQKPGDDEQQPGDDEQKPGDDEQQPGDDEQKPGDDEQKPGDDQKDPSQDSSKGNDGQKKPDKTTANDQKKPENTNNKSKSPKTGDESDALPYAVVMILSAAGICVTAEITRRKRNSDCR